MRDSETLRLRRRDLLFAAPVALAAVHAAAEDRQAPAKPRAIAGDRVEPEWESRLSITVGPAKADLVGGDEKAIQAGVDYMAGWGGGTVRVLPGTYRLRNAVFLRSGVRILGSGTDSVLVKAPQLKSMLSDNSDFWDQEITLADPSGFEVGDGICLQVDKGRHGGRYITRRTLVARSGNRFKLDRPLIEDDFTLKGGAHVRTLYPLICGEGIRNAVVENIALDGNRAEQETLYHYWGNYVAGIWLDRSNDIRIRDVTSRGSCADGVSWQMSHDVTVEDCHCHDNVGFGLHPGSGSQRPVARGNRLERNYIGFYFCYGIRNGLVENNTIVDSETSGVSIGHKDTDNLVRANRIRGSREVGVLFRALDPVWAPHRNRVEENEITDSGGESGIAIDVQGEVRAAVLARNSIRETRQTMKRIGVRIGARTEDVQVLDNRIEGFAVDVADLRKTAG